MWFINLTLLVLKLSVSAEGFSTCQSYNLDDHKSKRIEAVRGQILSKLRIRSPPDPEARTPPESVPVEVMLLYNSTKELLKERARQAEAACERESSEEDYYAKEVQRINMMPLRTDTSEWYELYLIWLSIQRMHCGSGCVIKPNTSAQFNLPISKLVVCVR